MPAQTLVIAECGSSWDLDLSKAERLINAAKECDAQIAKFQWTSNAEKMAARRGNPEWATGYRKWLQYPREWLDLLKAMCDKAGIEFAVTCYLIEDIAVIAPLVKRYKISAFEAKWYEFVRAHSSAIVSCNDHTTAYNVKTISDNHQVLLCTSEYPTAIEKLGLRYLNCGRDDESPFDGLSDHTANVLTGAAAVAAGARIIEAHIRLHDTDVGNPDYGHSLSVDEWLKDGGYWFHGEFRQYVRNIRTVERML